jgi:hypothetical protein
MTSSSNNKDIKQGLAELTNSASVVTGATQLTFQSDVAFDIETSPAKPDIEEASLIDAQVARVASIGYYVPHLGRCFISYDPAEADMLRQFWQAYVSVASHGAKMIGFNIFGFDLPFLIRRSWHHGVCVPRSAASNGRFWSWSDTFVDLMAAWKCGSYKDYISLDKLARFLGIGEKCGSGTMFYRLWDTDRQAAITYLVNDCKMTHGCAVRMGFTANVA